MDTEFVIKLVVAFIIFVPLFILIESQRKSPPVGFYFRMFIGFCIGMLLPTCTR